MSALAHANTALQIDPASQKSLVLLEKLDDIQHHAIAQQATLSLVENPRWDLVEDELFIADVDRMTRVSAALVPGHDVDTLGQNIDDLTFAFVTPLAAYDDLAAAWTLGFGH